MVMFYILIGDGLHRHVCVYMNVQQMYIWDLCISVYEKFTLETKQL